MAAKSSVAGHAPIIRDCVGALQYKGRKVCEGWEWLASPGCAAVQNDTRPAPYCVNPAELRTAE